MIDNDTVMTHGAELHDKKIHSNIEDTSFFDIPPSRNNNQIEPNHLRTTKRNSNFLFYYR